MVGVLWTGADFHRHFRKPAGPERTSEAPSGLLAVPLRSPERVPKTRLLHAWKRFRASLLKSSRDRQSTGRALRIAACAVPVGRRPHVDRRRVSQHGFESPTGTDGMYTVQAVEWFAA